MAKKTKIVEYDCIVVVAGVMDELQQIGIKYIDAPFSEQTIYNALKYSTNSDAAKEIRKVALERGGRRIKKTKVVFMQ